MQILNQATEVIPIDAVKPHPDNPRKGDLPVIRESIENNGFYGSVIVQKSTGFILAGNHRYLAALETGAKEIPVTWIDVEDDQAARIMLADNRTSDLGSYDDEILSNLLESLKESTGTLLGTGYDDGALDELLESVGRGVSNNTQGDDDPEVVTRADELQQKWQVKFGDIWEIGKHRIMCGDSADPNQIELLMKGDKANLVFTDPPYGVSIGKKNVFLNSFQKAGRNLTDIEDDDLTSDQLKQRLLPAFKNIKNIVMADDCTVFVTAPQGGELSMMMMMMMQEAGLRVRHVLIWKKNAPTFSMGRLDYDYQHEPILLTWGKKHKRPMNGEHKTSVWEIAKPMAAKEHPTMKPVELYVNGILNNSDKGDITFDAYSGSGTMLVASEQTGRMARVMEITEGYTAVALERLTNLGLEAKLIHRSSEVQAA